MQSQNDPRPMRGNVFSGGTIDRAAKLRRDPDALAESLRHPDSRFLLVRDNRSLVARSGDGFQAHSVAVADPADAVFLGLVDGRAYFALDTEDEAIGEFADLRQIASLLPAADAALLAYARAILQWRRNHLYCG